MKQCNNVHADQFALVQVEVQMEEWYRVSQKKNIYVYIKNSISNCFSTKYLKCKNALRAAPVAQWLRWLISLSPLTIRSSHHCDWCGFEPHTGHKWDKSSSTCGCVRWFFPGYSRFRPTFWLARLDMSEIILKGTLNWTKKKNALARDYILYWIHTTSHKAPIFYNIT